MKTRYTVVLSMVAGAALGGAAMQGVNAQLAAKKAYTVTELETLNPQASFRRDFLHLQGALTPKAHKKQAVAVGPLRSAPGAEQTQ